MGNGGLRSKLERLQGFLARDPENGNLRAEIFDTALAAGDMEAARAQVAHERGRDAGHPGWRHREAVLLLATQRYPEAQTAFEALLGAGHDDPAIRYNLAFALFQQGKLDATMAVLEPLLALQEGSTGLEWPLWLRSQHRARRMIPGLERFRERLAQHPMPAEALGVASLMAADEGRLEEAQRWSDACLQHQPDQLEALATRGTLALAAQDSASAVQWFGRALVAHPTDGRCWSGMALARMLAGDLVGANEGFERAVRSMPEHVGTWIAWGTCRLVTNELDQARRCFEEALRLDPSFAESHGIQAVLLARAGKAEEARREMEVARRLDPASIGAQLAGELLGGQPEDQRGFLRLAQRALGRARGGAGPGPATHDR